jgi:predicted DCC family thiol-disulfide oxidoreductase YuxK
MSVPAPIHDLVFYDGECGLCHRLVRFTIAQDREGRLFRYAPLGGMTFIAQYPGLTRARLPDSIVVHAADGRTLVRSAAMIHIGERLGGGWRVAARIGSLLPRWLLDLCYDGIAMIRGRLFARPETTCPLLPPELGGRFLP